MSGSETGSGRPPGLLQPLVHRGFALIAAATLVSNVGVWMRDTTSAWTMASHAQHHSAVALVQAAATFPVFLLALPAGVLADHYDRRRLLIACQVALALVGGALAVLAYTGSLTPGRLVLLALAAGAAAALAAPAWQAIVPSLVPRSEIPSAVAVSSIGFNIARVLGPACGGIILAASGPAMAYACNAAAYGATILALLVVSSASAARTPSSTFRFRDEIHQGLHFVGESAAFRVLLARGASLYFLASCYLTLTPLVAHDILTGGAGGYGALLGAIGSGSIAGGVVLSIAHRKRIADETLLAACSAAGALALLTLSQATGLWLACLALAVAGGATLIQLATYNAAAQLLLPEAIRGRGLAIYMAVTFGMMAIGSLAWGSISDVFSIEAALLLGAAGFCAAGLAGRQAALTGPAIAGTAA